LLTGKLCLAGILRSLDRGLSLLALFIDDSLDLGTFILSLLLS
jgi:hypothetical protein